MFDAWMNRRLSVHERVLAVVRARMFLHNWYHHIKVLSRAFPDLYSLARSFISPASFNIFNRICDNLISLVMAYAKYYPDHPFCPWLMGTEFIEHFFGLARSLLPDFAYAELLKMVKHIMTRQKLLLGGKFDDRRERNSRSGYILDYDATPLTSEELSKACIIITTLQINQLVELGHREADVICRKILHLIIPKAGTPLVPLSGPSPSPKSKNNINTQNTADSEDEEEIDNWEGDDEESDGEEDTYEDDPEDDDEAATVIAATRDAARYSELTAQFEATLEEAQRSPEPDFIGPPPPPLPPPPPSPPPLLVLKSDILNDDGSLSILKMLNSRDRHQSSTTTHSERVLAVDPKFNKEKTTANENPDIVKLVNLSVKEGSHRVSVAQDLALVNDKPKKMRQMRWQMVANELSRIIPTQGQF